MILLSSAFLPYKSVFFRFSEKQNVGGLTKDDQQTIYNTWQQTLRRQAFLNGPSSDEGKTSVEVIWSLVWCGGMLDKDKAPGTRWPARPCSSLWAGGSDQTLNVAVIWVTQTLRPQSGGPQTGWPHCCMCYREFPRHWDSEAGNTSDSPMTPHTCAPTVEETQLRQHWTKMSKVNITNDSCSHSAIQCRTNHACWLSRSLSLSLSHPHERTQTHTRSDPEASSDAWSYISWAKISFAPLSGPHFLTILAFPL